MKKIVTYKFYNKKGDRLAIKGEESGEKIQMTIIRCSRQDHFSKKIAREAFDNKDGKYHPVTFEIENEGDFRKSFFEYCYENFYLINNMFFSSDVLICPISGDTKQIGKLNLMVW